MKKISKKKDIKALKAAQYLRRYCEKQGIYCTDKCIFYRYIGEGVKGCVLLEGEEPIQMPRVWYLTKSEREAE